MKRLKALAGTAALALGLSACSMLNVNASDTLNGSMLITESGTYTISEDVEGSVVVDASDDDVIEIILDGCSITSEDSAAIYVRNAGEVTVTAAEGTVNYLTNLTGFEADGDTNVDGVIFSKDDLTISGEGTIIIDSADHGIVSKDDLIIESGTITITSAGDGCQANDELIINGGSLEITECTEGLEGTSVTINGGDIAIFSSDDAVNAAGESGDSMTADSACSVTINGGTLDITTEGDGIDSNGSFTVNGGYITISGPLNSGNGSLDFAGSGVITGGTVVAAGISGMEMNFTETSQGSILISTGDQTSGTPITVTDDSGNVIVEFTPSVNYNYVLISSPDLTLSGTYTVTCGEFEEEITLENYIFGNGAGGFGLGGGRQGPQGGFNGQTPPELPDDFDGQTPPELPDNFDGQMPPVQPQTNQR